jgi:zeaxanthin glucosyltransferase
MARIAFVAWPEVGHLHSPIVLARRLRERGHEPLFLLDPAEREMTALLEGQGFEVQPFWPSRDAAPTVGPLEELLGELAGLASDHARLWASWRRETLAWRETVRWVEERAHEVLASHGIDLLLVDMQYSYLVLSGLHAGVRALQYYTGLPHEKRPGVPPLWSSVIDTRGPAGRLRVEKAWLRFSVWQKLTKILWSGLGTGAGHCTANESLAALFARMAARVGLDPRRIVDDRALWFVLRLPMMIFCPAALDLAPVPGRYCHYVEPSVDPDRPAPPLAPGSLDPARPLVLCSLGSRVVRSAEARRFHRGLLDLFAARPHLQAVVAAGSEEAVRELGSAPRNVLVTGFAPQMALLKRARAMITHGGLNSIKECVMSGVPMVVCPADVDQPGNAARVVHHGLGLGGVPLARVRPDRLGRELDRVLDEPAFRERVDRLRLEFWNQERRRPSLALVERTLASPPGAL